MSSLTLAVPYLQRLAAYAVEYGQESRLKRILEHPQSTSLLKVDPGPSPSLVLARAQADPLDAIQRTLSTERIY